MEFRSVIFIGLGHFPEVFDEREQAKLLYVGLTRARERLILTASEETPLTERLSSIAA